MNIKEDILTDEGKIICELTNIFTNKNKEIDRLNNILDELEKMFDGDLDGFFTINNYGACNEIIEVLQNYKDKLKELKENNKDE